jgi:hypothetical protein
VLLLTLLLVLLTLLLLLDAAVVVVVTFAVVRDVFIILSVASPAALALALAVESALLDLRTGKEDEACLLLV